MPAIPDEYVNCVVFLYTSEERAREGNTAGGGTGFFVKMPLATGAAYYVVTNKHCADHVPTMRLHATDGTWRYLKPQLNQWLDHPEGDDLSACQLELGAGFATPRGVLMYATEDTRSHGIYGAALGADAFFAGRYVTLSGIDKDTPMLRFGNVAMMPTPIQAVDRFQESFVVEARSRIGFSGSPVFVYSLETSNEKARMNVGHWKSYDKAEARNIRLLGVVWGHLDEWEPVHTGRGSGAPLVPDHWSKHNTNLACVVPAWKVTELLNRTEFQEMRRQTKERCAAESATQDFAADEQSRPT